jgi:2-polyprenyl-3-methyl-5-hydroxy-6-metoxy-1,4-benzoquinol methylase
MEPKKIVEKGYQKIAEKYHSKRLESSRSLEMLKKIIKRMPKKGKVLDVGCGGGYPVAKFFANLGYDVTGVDFSSEMIKIAKKTVPEGEFYEKDMTKLDFPNESFDIIVSFYAIIHVPRVQHAKIISKFHEMLKPKGIIFVCMGFEDVKEHVSSDWLGAEMYWSHFDKETNLKMIKDAGFRIIWNEDRRPEDDMPFTWILDEK